MRSDWKEKSLGDVVSITGGGTPSRGVPSFWNGGIPWATVKDFVGLDLVKTKEYISEEGLRKSASNLIPAGRVIIPTRMALGKAAINSIPMAINQDLKALACCDLLEPRYFLRWFISNASVIDRMGSGATVKGITLDQLTSLKIPLPPLPEQRRIAAILDKADDIRRKRAETIRLSDDFLKSTFLDMFGDPVTNPKGWPLCTLSDHYMSPKDGTKCGPFGGALKKSEFVDSGVSVWNMDNIADNGERKGEPSLWIPEDKFEELRAYSVNEGDIIISRAGTVGKMCVIRGVPCDSIISTNLIRLRLADSLLPEFFVSLMTLCKGRVERLKTGPDGAFTHMSTGVLDTLTFPYPPPDLQKNYAKILRKVRGMAKRQNSATDGLSDLFGTLSQQAFQGRL